MILKWNNLSFVNRSSIFNIELRETENGREYVSFHLTDRSGCLKPIFLSAERTGGFLVAFKLIVNPFRCDIHNIYHCAIHTSIITSRKPTGIRYYITCLSYSLFNQMIVEAP